MTWFKVDDGFWSNPKVLNLSDEATALWVRAGSYCCQHLTDGVVLSASLRVLGSIVAATELVDAGLWRTTNQGYVFHDWGEYQETSQDVKLRREQAKERQRKRRKSRNSHGDVTRDKSVTHDERHAPVTREFATPDPTRPDPTRPTSSNEEVTPPSPPPGGSAGKRTKNTYPEDFEKFWKPYPKKAGKPKALENWRKAIRSGVDPDQIAEAAAGYARLCEVSGTPDSKIKHPQGWISDGRYEDDYPALIESARPNLKTVPNQSENTPAAWGMSPEAAEAFGLDWGAPPQGGVVDAEIVDVTIEREIGA